MQDDPIKCQWCGNFHATKCPMVKAIEYFDNGLMKRVEFYSATDYHKEIWKPTSEPFASLPDRLQPR